MHYVILEYVCTFDNMHSKVSHQYKSVDIDVCCGMLGEVWTCFHECRSGNGKVNQNFTLIWTRCFCVVFGLDSVCNSGKTAEIMANIIRPARQKNPGDHWKHTLHSCAALRGTTPPTGFSFNVIM